LKASLPLNWISIWPGVTDRAIPPKACAASLEPLIDTWARKPPLANPSIRPSSSDYAQISPWRQPRTVNTILSAVRGFFQFRVRQGLCEENPLKDVPALPQRTFVPFIFSPQQTDRLLSAVCQSIRKTEKNFPGDLAVWLAIMLLARCGMRLSEPLGLLRIHWRPQEETLYIENTKFGKDRLIPVPGLVGVQMRKAQVDGGGVEGIGCLGQLHPEGLVCIELPGRADQGVSEVGPDAPIPTFVGMSQGASGNRAADPYVIGLRVMGAQTTFDVAQALSKRQLGKGPCTNTDPCTRRT